MLIVKNDTLLSAVALAGDTDTSLDLSNMDQGSLQLTFAPVTVAVKTFTDTAVNVLANTVTIASHGYATGLKVVTTTSGAAPGGLGAGTYYIIKVDASTIKFASSAANAMAGTAIDITSAGGVGDTQTITPASIGTITFTIKVSNDGTNWATTSLAHNYAGASTVMLDLVDKYYKYAKLATAIAAGQITLTAILFGKQY